MLVQLVLECCNPACPNHVNNRSMTIETGPHAGETVQLGPLRYGRILDDETGEWHQSIDCPSCGHSMEQVIA